MSGDLARGEPTLHLKQQKQREEAINSVHVQPIEIVFSTIIRFVIPNQKETR
jgi:hypothetical protein